MTTPRIKLRIYESEKLLDLWVDFEQTILVGRQDVNEPAPYAVHELRFTKERKVIIASESEIEISRRQYLLTPLPDGEVEILNEGKSQVTLPDGRALAAPFRRPDGGRALGGSCRVKLPLLLPLPAPFKRTRAVRLEEAEDGKLQSLGSPPLLPSLPDMTTRLPSLTGASRSLLGNNDVIDWLQAVLQVLEAAADSDAFFTLAAKAAVEMIDLSSAQVLLLDQEGDWKVRASFPVRANPLARRASDRVLRSVLREKKTFRKITEIPAGEHSSIAGIDAVVAAPILNREGEVIGALYGERYLTGTLAIPSSLSQLEAKLVELLAGGIALGRARLEKEQEAVKGRALFEQFFTRDLADSLVRNPGELLSPRIVQATVLFCDIRGYSKIVERLDDAKLTLDWTQDVLEEMSRCVLEEHGVLVDYIGDSLMALWGAPGEQDDHAERACRAALSMLAGLPGLNQRWRAKIGAETSLSLGVNTGQALVGNTGARCKFKYGALGNTVNLASRIQGATKHLRCPLLISKATRDLLGDGFCTRRLALIRVINIDEPVEVHELLAEGRPDWPGVRDEYESALRDFADKDFRRAARALGGRRTNNGEEDGPALVLMYRAVRCMIEGPLEGHPVWTLADKGV